MKIKATISPLTQIGSAMVLRGIYPVNGKMRILTPSFNVVHEADMNKLKDYQPNNIVFDKNRPELVLSYDSDVSTGDSESLDKRYKDTVELFFAQHPEVLYNSQRHNNIGGAIPKFNCSIDANRIVSGAKTFKDTLAVQNKLNNMSHGERRDVADYYGISPNDEQGDEKKEQELLLELVAVCTQPDAVDGFLSTWLHVGGDTEMRVVVNKALRLGVIELRKNQDQEVYYLNNVVIGSSFDTVLAYCKANEAIYSEHILRIVAEKDTFESTASDLDTEALRLSKNGTAGFEAMRVAFDSLQKEGYIPQKNEFGKKIAAWHFRAKQDVLKEMINAAEKKKTQALTAVS